MFLDQIFLSLYNVFNEHKLICNACCWDCLLSCLRIYVYVSLTIINGRSTQIFINVVDRLIVNYCIESVFVRRSAPRILPWSIGFRATRMVMLGGFYNGRGVEFVWCRNYVGIRTPSRYLHFFPTDRSYRTKIARLSVPIGNVNIFRNEISLDDN